MAGAASPIPRVSRRSTRRLERLLEDAGAEVVVAATPHALDPDAIYAYDPAIVGDDGAVMLRPGKKVDGARWT